MSITLVHDSNSISPRKSPAHITAASKNFPALSGESHLLKTYKKFFASSPGKYFFSISFCITLILAAGIGNFITLNNRLSSFDYIRSKQEPLREATKTIDYNTKTLRNSLNSFVLSVETTTTPAQLAEKNTLFYANYHHLIQTISSSLTTASLNDPLHLILVQLNQLSPELSRLFELGELILQNVKDNYPLALAQMATFNAYCDNVISPITSNLIAEQNDYTAEILKEYSSPSYASLGLSILSIISLICLSIWFSWRSKRIINKSILLAICIMLYSVFWFYTSATNSSQDIKYINNKIYQRLISLNNLESDILSIQFLQFQLINTPYQQNKIFLVLENKISHAQAIIADNTDNSANEPEIRAIFSAMHNYLTVTENFVNQHKNKRSIITLEKLMYDFTLPQHIFDQSSAMTKSIEQRIVSQIAKAQSRYAHILPFYYLLSVVAILALNYARLTRMREYR